MTSSEWKFLSRDEFKVAVDRFDWNCQIDSFHMHHTFEPSYSTWKGAASMQSMYDFHTGPQRKWSDIAQHISICPEGLIWVARDWNTAPVSAANWNGTNKKHPFMCETVGNFNYGKDVLEGNQLESLLFVVNYILHFHKLPLTEKTVLFHRQFRGQPNGKLLPGDGADKLYTTDCPGTGLKKTWFMNLLQDYKNTTLQSFIY